MGVWMSGDNKAQIGLIEGTPGQPGQPGQHKLSCSGGILGQIARRFQPQSEGEQAVAAGDVAEISAPISSECAESLHVLIRPPTTPRNGLCGKAIGGRVDVWRRGSSASYEPVEWEETRAIEMQAAINARLDEIVAALPPGYPHRAARLNVLANERGIVASLLAKRDPILWGWLNSLERMLARWEEEDAAERRQQPQGP
jgi:hypothetical protein